MSEIKDKLRMSDKKPKNRIYKPKKISGFPEWLPEVKRAEQKWFDEIRRVFESYGFCPIETPSVEELDAINAKGGDGESDADKEIYVIERLHKQEGDKESRLALHFDQTVPLARYTAQHFNDLVFPFKRYQMQRVWRGERPQAGRFREFYQCDIDVINVDNLPLHFDAEMPAIIWEILSSLPGMENENIQIRISNRKILMGYLQSIGITDNKKIIKITRAIDKLAKQGNQHVIGKDVDKFGGDNNGFILLDDKGNISTPSTRSEIDTEIIENITNFIEVTTVKYNSSDELEDALTNNRHFDTSNQMLKEGIEELAFVMDQLSHLPEGAVVADLSIVRGLDYYTGTVYETVFTDDPSYGSICSGGRYDDLASNYINKKLPGVGISIGLSRLFDRIRLKGNLPLSGISPADILITLPSEEARPTVMEAAQQLRKNGLNVETFHSPAKDKKQFAYAEKKGIRYIWFIPTEGEANHSVKDLTTGDKFSTTPQDWKAK